MHAKNQPPSCFALLVFVTVLMIPPASVQAQKSYPIKPVRVVVPFQPGGSIDILARLFGAHLSERLGQQFIVENRAGAGGTMGADAVAKAPADGYTLLVTAQGPMVMNPFLMKKLPYDAQTAFAPISVIADAPNVLVVNPDMPIRSVADFVSYGKAHPEKMTFASQGIGTTGHVTGVMIHQQIGLDLTHVPYKGFSAMFTDVRASRVGMMIADTFNVVPHIRSKELIAVAVTAKQRSSALPDVPTFAESGFPGVVSGPSFSLLAPAGTPMAIRELLAQEVKKILKAPDVVEKLKGLGAEGRGTTPAETDAFLKAEYLRWGSTIRAANISLED